MQNQNHTPHINANPEDFASTVLMPGDPLRSRFIAENYLENAVLINDVRGVQGYTGTYKGKRVSVMASGMGAPSMGIYSHELFSRFGVDNIIRIGSAGAISTHIKLRDIVVGMGVSTNSSYGENFGLPGTFAPICSYKLLTACAETARRMGKEIHVGNLLSTDIFYNDGDEWVEKWSKMGVMAVEMESSALYMNAARLGKNALTICTVSDHIVTGENTTADERRTSFTEMMELALETAIKLD